MTELQETVTTMDPVASRWSIISFCISGEGPPVVWSHDLFQCVWGNCSLGDGAYPTFPQSRACAFFSVLAPAGRGGGRCLDTFSTTRYLSSNSLQSWFRVADFYLAGPPGGSAGLQTRFTGLPGGPAASFATKL